PAERRAQSSLGGSMPVSARLGVHGTTAAQPRGNRRITMANHASEGRRRRRPPIAQLCVLAISLIGCGAPPGNNNDADGGAGGSGGSGGGGSGGGSGGPTVALKRPSRSSTIALTDDGFLVIMVNPDDNSISIFKADDNSRVARLP